MLNHKGYAFSPGLQMAAAPRGAAQGNGELEF